VAGSASIILGAMGWVLARLIFEPMKEIVDLRREAQERNLESPGIEGVSTPHARPNGRKRVQSGRARTAA